MFSFSFLTSACVRTGIDACQYQKIFRIISWKRNARVHGAYRIFAVKSALNG